MTLSDILGYCGMIYAASLVISFASVVTTDLGDDDKKNGLIFVPIVNTILAIRGLWEMIKIAIK